MTEALFVMLSGPDPGVFDAQVLDYGRFMGALGVRFRYLLFDGFRAWMRSGRRAREEVQDLRRRFDAEIELRYMLRPLGGSGLRRATDVVVETVKALRGSGARLLIQARSPEGACVALEARHGMSDLAVLYDARGDAVAEALLEARQQKNDRQRRRWERRAVILERLESRARAEADHILAVSNVLRDRICSEGKVPRNKITVVPCCVNMSRFQFSEAAREAVRARLNLEGKFVLVYSGSLTSWQIPDRLADFVQRLLAADPEAHLLVLSRDVEGAHRFFGRLLDAGRCTLTSCLYEEVGQYLAGADAGLLIRQDDPVNRVACPVKFAEYQTSGLPVILTSDIGDVSEYIEKTGYGAVLRNERPLEEQIPWILEAIRKSKWGQVRKEISEKAKAVFGRDSYRESYLQVLDQLGVLPAKMAVATGGSTPPR